MKRDEDGRLHVDPNMPSDTQPSITSFRSKWFCGQDSGRMESLPEHPERQSGSLPKAREAKIQGVASSNRMALMRHSHRSGDARATGRGRQSLLVILRDPVSPTSCLISLRPAWSITFLMF